MVTVATYSNLSDAFLLKSFLEGDGIPVLIPDEYVAQSGGLGIVALGGIRVQVPEAFSERAEELVSAFQRES